MGVQNKKTEQVVEDSGAKGSVVTEVDATDDLSIQREKHNEFTHAKFLDEAKVAKRFDEQIRPIMAKTVSQFVYPLAFN